MDYQLYTSHQSDWISFLLIAIAMSYGLLHYFNFYTLKEAISVFSSSLTKEQETNHSLINALLNVNTLLVFALFVYLFVQQNSLDHFVPSGLFFLRIVFATVFLVALQKLSLRVHSFFTNTVSFFGDYLKTYSRIAQLSAVLALPFLFGSLFIPDFQQALLITGMTVFSGVYLFGILKTIGFNVKLKGGIKIHIIFYLCGIEILPLLLLFKLLI